MIDLAQISPPNRCRNYLLVVRLDNARAIAAAYGEEAVKAAMAHLCAAAASFDPVEVRKVHGDEMILLGHAAMLEPDFVCARIDAFCTQVCLDPVPSEAGAILLSVSVGHSDPVPGDLNDASALAEARARLERVASPAAAVDPAAAAGQACYRADMARAVRLLAQVANGETFFAWRPIFDPRSPERVLQHEALLRYAGDQGEQFDCCAAYEALERLGLAHLLDRHQVLRVLDELEADPRARLSIAISPQSLSFDLGGLDAAWTDLLARLERNPALAGRLTLEFHETTACRFWPGTLTFLNTLRELGVGLGLYGFGSGHASVRQLAVLRPNFVKLDSAFLRTAFLSERNRARIGQLFAQAQSLCDRIVLTGVETPAQIRLAVEEGAEWVTGARLGRVSTRRAWTHLQASASDRVPALRAPAEPSAPTVPVAFTPMRAWQSPVF